MRLFYMRYWLYALLAALIPILSEMALWSILGQSGRMFDEPPRMLMTMAMSASPFLLFALLSKLVKFIERSAHVSGSVGLLIVLLLWLWVCMEGYMAQTNMTGGGANIGLGIIMLFSPFFVFAVMLVMSLLGILDRKVK